MEARLDWRGNSHMLVSMPGLFQRLIAPKPRAVERDSIPHTLHDGRSVDIQRVRDPRAKRIKLSVDERGARLTLPLRASLVSGDRFLHEHRQWLSLQLAKYSSDDDLPELVRARDDLLEVMPAAHLRVLQGLELMVVVGDYAFVHAGIRPGVPLSRQKAEDLLWIRGPFLDQTNRFEKRIVHGHSWIEAAPEIYDNRIGLDTGAYETGVLTAVRIEDNAVEVFQTRG